MIGQVRLGTVEARGHTDKKEKKIFLLEVQSGALLSHIGGRAF